jgi:polyferredoxin
LPAFQAKLFNFFTVKIFDLFFLAASQNYSIFFSLIFAVLFISWICLLSLTSERVIGERKGHRDEIGRRDKREREEKERGEEEIDNLGVEPDLSSAEQSR